MGTSKKQKKREWLRYRDFVLSPYGVIKIKSLGYISGSVLVKKLNIASALLNKHILCCTHGETTDPRNEKSCS
ncbi:hypothetical protein [Symbiopectobacterium sp. RP]|uniref:hypothetical protein n=1 Tax=Symbiopectobacterium sp. RP TaxID=3248553 RepID=UPI003D2B04CD